MDKEQRTTQDKTYTPGLAEFSQCYSCAYFVKGTECNAYDVIPLALFENREDHREEYEGDGGVRFYAKTMMADFANDKRWREINKEALARREEIKTIKSKYWGD